MVWSVTVQASQSSIASGKESRSEQFAALRRISRRLEVAEGAEGVGLGRGRVVADRVGMLRDLGELLEALQLSTYMVASPTGVPDPDGSYAAELELLRKRSWAVVEHMLLSARRASARELERDSTVEGCRMPESGGRAALKPQVIAAEVLGPEVLGPGRIGPRRVEWVEMEGGEVLPPQRHYVVQGAAGWIAC